MTKPWFFRTSWYVVAALMLVLAWMYKFLELRAKTLPLQTELRGNILGLPAKVSYFQTDAYRIRYAEIGNDSLPLLVFIHGAPSSIGFWRSLMTNPRLLRAAKMLAIERPGYGFTQFGRPDTVVANQARALASVINTFRNKHKRIILHGSSYGGTIAARIAMDYPTLLDGLILQSSSLAPGQEKIFGATYFTKSFPWSKLIPPAIAVANAEKLSHRNQLDAMRPLWQQIRIPVTILHGTDDGLIYPENARFAFRQLVNAPCKTLIWAPGRGHDLLWTERELLIQQMLVAVKGD